MDITVAKLFSAKLSLNARILLFVILGAKYKLRANTVAFQLLYSKIPMDAHSILEALGELTKEGYITGTREKIVVNEDKFNDTPYQKLLESVKSHRKGTSPTKMLLKRFDALYRKCERTKRRPEKGDYLNMHRLVRHYPLAFILESMDVFFDYVERLKGTDAIPEVSVAKLVDHVHWRARKQKDFSK